MESKAINTREGMESTQGDLTFSAPPMSEAALSPEPDPALQAQLAAIVEATPDGIALIEPHGTLRYLNPAGRAMLGLEPHQPLSAFSIFDFCPPSLHTLLLQEALPTALHEGRWSTETELLDGKGRAFPVFLTLFSHKTAHVEVSSLSLILRDISAQKRKEAELTHLAHYDALTGLFNRLRFQEELNNYLAQIRRYDTQGALLLIDVDRFKVVNDTFGHQGGDMFLRDLATLFCTQLREVDTLARLGGDEFAVLISTQDAKHAAGVAKRLLQAVHHHTTVVAGHPLQCTISIGVALIPQHGSTADEVFEHADLALYQAKMKGRDQFRLFTAKKKE